MLRALSLLVVSFTLFTLLACTPAQAPRVQLGPLGHAVAIGYGGRIDTDIPLDVLGGDHTVMAWVLFQYPHAYAGPIFAENGRGAWALGQADYRWGDGGYKRKGPPVLYLQVGGEQVVAAPGRDIKPLEWRHLAVVRRGDHVSLHVDGGRVADLDARGGSPARGTLRIGRRTDGQACAPAAYEAQFYGLVDDVAVYARALGDDELVAAATPGAHPRVGEPGLVAALTFEDGAPAARLVGAASRVPVSANRDGAADAQVIPYPNLQVPLRLPLATGEAWKVIQGNDRPGGSHNGFASFSWDLVLAGRPSKETQGRVALASGPGQVVWIEDGNPDGSRGANHVMIRHTEAQFSAYMHLMNGSPSEALGQGTMRRGEGPMVQVGQRLGLTGDTGAGRGNYHLHISISNRGAHDKFMVTIPAAFIDYEVSDDEGRNWRYVPVGIPQRGQWVRRVR